VTGHPLLLASAFDAQSELRVIDLADPLKPQPLCSLRQADGGRFTSATRIAFWHGKTLGAADLNTGSISSSERLQGKPGLGAFSRDGSAFAYRLMTDQGWTTHLYVGGRDRTLVTVGPIGGHGGPPYGPADQLEFSADGQYLLDASLFMPSPGPAQFTVYRIDGSLAFQSAEGEFGAWSPTGSTLYFLRGQIPADINGDLHRWAPSTGEVTVLKGLTGFFWPAVAPDGKSIVFNRYDRSAPSEATGGLPHLWQIDLGRKTQTQISPAVTSNPLFVSPRLIWSDEEERCECGPGGASAPNGRVIAHDLVGRQDLVVDLGALSMGPRPLAFVLDVRPD
jgi:hypothetical protein